MPKILLGIALAALLGAAALAFLAKGNAEKLQGILASTKNDLAMTRGKLKKTETDLQTRTEELTAANAKIEEKDKEIANLKGQMDDLNKKIADAAAAMEAKTAAMDALQKEFDEYKKLKEGGKPPVPGGVGGVELESPIVTALKGDLVKAQAEAAESKALVDSLTAKKKELEDKMVALEQYKKAKEKEIWRGVASGRILAVNPGWNFVVISIGDKEGAAMNATMLVVRDGTPIGKVRVTTVEPNSSIADIIPGTLGKGVTIQPGDRVIFEGRTPAVGAAPAAGVRGAAPAPLR